MPVAERWTVSIDVDEFDACTRAHARLHTRDSDKLVGTGEARLNPTDREVPEIGDELAAARALRDLADRLLDTGRADVEQLSTRS